MQAITARVESFLRLALARAAPLPRHLLDNGSRRSSQVPAGTGSNETVAAPGVGGYQNQLTDLKHKTAVLTGAGSGFGLECARLGATLGMNLVHRSHPSYRHHRFVLTLHDARFFYPASYRC